MGSPFIASTAACAASPSAYVTKPKPREREGSSRSMITTASTISPVAPPSTVSRDGGGDGRDMVGRCAKRRTELFEGLPQGEVVRLPG
jgi:hypothetical protein